MTSPDTLDPGRLRDRLRMVDPVAAARPADALRVIRAPGRVNLIGEHTDYNDGFVMPAAIRLEIRLAILPTDDRRVTITLDESGETDGFDLDVIGSATGGWIDYVAGVAWALAETGRPLTGFRGLLASDLPRGAGLSSSAALGMAAALALLGPDANVPPLPRALAGRRSENGYVGVQSGIMDELASAAGIADHAIVIDCRSLEWRPVPLPLSDVALVVCHSGSSRRLDTSAYNERRAECERAVAAIAAIEPGVRSLRDVDPPMLAAAIGRMDPVAARRAQHVVDEDARVLRDRARPRGRRPGRGRPALRSEPRLAARPVRGQLARARCPGRDRHRDRRRRRRPDDGRGLRRIDRQPRPARPGRRLP